MEQAEMRVMLERVSSGETSVDEALLKLKMDPFEDLGFAKIDLHRGVRTGSSEVIYGEGKTASQINSIVRLMWERGQRTILITRISPEKSRELEESLREDPSMECVIPYHYNEEGRIALAGKKMDKSGIGTILVLTAGTSDIPVAEEAAVTAEALGNDVVRVYDAGVAGLERLLAHLRDIMSASVIIAIAGMEGALPVVVTGLADCPVIAVPTSGGYGTSLGGVSALLSMLNACASGMCVENIDNGFGAGYFASMINHMNRQMERQEHLGGKA